MSYGDGGVSDELRSILNKIVFDDIIPAQHYQLLNR